MSSLCTQLNKFGQISAQENSIQTKQFSPVRPSLCLSFCV